MSVTLSPTPAGPIFHDYPYDRSSPSSNSSSGTVRYYGCRQVSSSSLPLETAYCPNPAQSTPQERVNPGLSCSPVQLSNSVSRLPLRNALNQAPPKSGWPANETHNYVSLVSLSTKSLHSVSIQSESNFENTSDGFSTNLTARNAVERRDFQPPESRTSVNTTESVAATAQPFKRWLSMLRRRKLSRGSTQSSYQLLLSEPDNNDGDYDDDVRNDNRRSLILGQAATKLSGRRNSTSHGSSTGFVSAVRSATMTVASTSLASRSWIGGRLGYLRRSDPSRSARTSQDSYRSYPESVLDEKAWARAVQRRKILEEIIESEESYVADLKVLVNVYFTLLTSICALSTSTQASIRENITDILQMHEVLLGELHETVPNSRFSQSHAKIGPISRPQGHVRWRSADSVPTRPKEIGIAHKFRRSLDLVRPARYCPIGTAADPKIAAAVAGIFDRFALQLFAYEEYGAKYEMMVRDLASTYKTLSSGQAFEKGIEILSKTLESINARDVQTKKCMTFADLVIKPIQRVCKYPLLFADLCKQTPVVDDPEAHAEIDKVLFRLKEAIHEINKATDDPKKRDLIEKTWLLQDRLRFPSQAYLSVISRMLGRVQLCGVLHVTYQTTAGIKGQYMLCALFKSCFVLAVNEKGLNYYSVVASIPLANVSIEDSDNGRGLQCHTAPFTWKIVFELDHRIFEMVLSACTPLEEGQWRKHLSDRVCIEGLDLAANQVATQDICSALTLDLKCIGTLYGQPHTLARRISIRRAATMGPKSQLSQVILRNTHSVDQLGRNPSETSQSLNRSQSLLSSSHVQILAPRRSDRINLETALSDVWTREIIPFPGMKQNENSFKASANHVMRKLSMASITSTLSKRTSSFVNFNKPDLRVPTPMDFSLSTSRSRTPSGLPDRSLQRPKKSRAVLSPPSTTVNFHKTPEMFLPPDFELKDPRNFKAAKQRVTIRAVSDEPSELIPHASSQHPMKISTSKLRRSVTTHVPPISPMETQGQHTKLPEAENDENTTVPGEFKAKATKDCTTSTTKPLKPFTKQIRRFFI